MRLKEDLSPESSMHAPFHEIGVRHKENPRGSGLALAMHWPAQGGCFWIHWESVTLPQQQQHETTRRRYEWIFPNGRGSWWPPTDAAASAVNSRVRRRPLARAWVGGGRVGWPFVFPSGSLVVGGGAQPRYVSSSNRAAVLQRFSITLPFFFCLFVLFGGGGDLGSGGGWGPWNHWKEKIWIWLPFSNHQCVKIGIVPLACCVRKMKENDGGQDGKWNK